MSTIQVSTMKLAGHWSARQISIVLTVVALILWAYSIIQAKLVIGFYGLIHSFPVIFFVALGILTIASAILWISKENHGKLLFFQLCFLIVSLWLTPIIVGGAQPFLYDTYSDLGFIEYITREGVFNVEAVWQHNWPAGWILWAAAIQLTGVTMDGFASLIPWIPFIWQFLLLLPLFVFFRNTIGRAGPNYCWAGMWLFYLGNNSFGLYNTGAQAFGAFFVLGLLALLTMTPALQQRARPFGHRVSAIIIFAVSAVTHLLGALVALAATAALHVSRRVRASNLVIIAAVFIAAWSIYGAWTFFEWRLPDFLEQAFRLGTATETGIVAPLAGSESHAAVSMARIIFSGLFAAVAVLGAFLAWRRRDSTYADITVLAIAVGCGIAAVVVGAGYSQELYQRFFLFLLPPMAYFGVKLLHLRATAAILTIFLLVALPLVFIARYGNQTIDYLTPGYLAGAHFFQDNTAHGYVTAAAPMGRMKNYEQYWFKLSFEELELEEGEVMYAGGLFGVIPHYISISNHDDASYSFYRDEPQLIDGIESSLRVSTNWNHVFANPDLSLYTHDVPE